VNNSIEYVEVEFSFLFGDLENNFILYCAVLYLIDAVLFTREVDTSMYVTVI